MHGHHEMGDLIRGTMYGSELGRSQTNESEPERNNRNLSDLLQELRVAGLGVQVLFGFLLGLPFTNHFTQLDGSGRVLYQVSLLCAALAPGVRLTAIASPWPEPPSPMPKEPLF